MEVEMPDRDFLKMESILIDDNRHRDMTCSLLSTASSLTSPVDSGVQLLDSESDLTSVMSASGCDLDKDTDCEQLNEVFAPLLPNREPKAQLMTKSDIVNQNVVGVAEPSPQQQYSTSAPSPKFLQKLTDDGRPEDVMNVSLNSYELLDYTMANTKDRLKTAVEDQMHVSLSEEVNESLQLLKNNPTERPPIEPDVDEVKPTETAPDEQIVFRRQRKKKIKSDTPKKRVSFHEDILNSTKIDDVHINHGFITIEPDVSTNFFLRGFSKRPDVVKGRYSWAAEGDAPYYEKARSDREVKSDIYVHSARYSSVSSSSSGSISSSIDEEDAKDEEELQQKKEPSLKMPKSSCLKKTKHRKAIDTNIVDESTASTARRKRSESNLLLDGNIFGSLKNILNFSTSAPLTERGVPEGQEDVLYSVSHDALKPPPVEKSAADRKRDNAKNNLKLTITEGYQPNKSERLPPNVVLCDSNVYEHKGISYSYEYDSFQKTFGGNRKPKSSTVYQTILKEFNFFRRRARRQSDVNDDDFEILTVDEPPTKDEQQRGSIDKYASSTKMDWSDTETLASTSTSSDFHPRHLNSPKKKIGKANHYAVQCFRADPATATTLSKSLPNASSSKNSLINRFLRNVTMKKAMDLRSQKKLRISRRYLGLYVDGARPDWEMSRRLDREIEDEIVRFKVQPSPGRHCDRLNKALVGQFRKEIFRDERENLVKVFPVSSAYTTSGEHRPLMVVLTDTTFYISGFGRNNGYANHFVLPYTELNTLLIGPDGQTLHVSNNDRDMQCVVTTGCGRITGDLVVALEMAMRRDANRPALPAVRQLEMRDMANLRRAICKQTAVNKDEEYFYYSIINLQECNSDNTEMPLGPNKEGPLMFKISDTESRWETAYFILKAGVLYMLSSPTYRVPMRVLPLLNGACQGAKRVYNCPRPHTFQLIVSGSTLHLAAPDEYVASEWLQALVHAASGTYTHREKLVAQACTLLMTDKHILTVREAFPCNIVPSKLGHDPIRGVQALSCATISDITSFRLPSAEQSWCILEFACREVHESSGDWILYFGTNSELENFIRTLEMLWAYHNEGESFPLSMMPEADQLSKRCVETYKHLQNSWPYFLSKV